MNTRRDLEQMWSYLCCSRPFPCRRPSPCWRKEHSFKSEGDCCGLFVLIWSTVHAHDPGWKAHYRDKSNVECDVFICRRSDTECLFFRLWMTCSAWNLMLQPSSQLASPSPHYCSVPFVLFRFRKREDGGRCPPPQPMCCMWQLVPWTDQPCWQDSKILKNASSSNPQ